MKRTSFEALSTLALYGLSTSRCLDYLKISMKVVQCQPAINVPRVSLKTWNEYSREGEVGVSSLLLILRPLLRPLGNGREGVKCQPLP